MKYLLPLILTILGVGIGSGLGMFLGPKAMTEDCANPPCPVEPHKAEDTDNKPTEADYVRLQNQFVVPVVKSERVQSLVVMSLSLEVEAGNSDAIFEREPKLRDSFLRVLFDHAHIGGFDGQFTQSGQLSVLRVALLEAAQAVIGREVTDILITDIVRQEL